MRFQYYAYFVSALILTSCAARNEELLIQFKLTNNWEFKSTSEDNWRKTSLPSDIISEVSRVKGSENRWFLSYHQLRTIFNASYEYRNIFDISKTLLSIDSITLSFPGIRGPASVYINDSLFLSGVVNEEANALSCKQFLKEGRNEMRIVFDSFNLSENKDYSYISREDDMVSTLIKGLENLPLQNMQNTPGLIEVPYITAWSVAKIEDVYFYPLAISDKTAQYNAEINIMASRETEMNLQISVDEKSIIKLYELKLKPGMNKQIVSFTIPNPKLWWTKGLGQQYLYKAAFRLFSSRQLVHEASFPLGARKLDIIYEPDSIQEPLKFLLNGKQVFLKGGILDIPNNLDPSEIEVVYHQIVENIKTANVNIIRLLRPDFNRPDLFYKLCSENGILIWQDFPISNVSRTRKIDYSMEQSVKYLRNMPCCAVYMGKVEGSFTDDKSKLASKTKLFVEKDLPLSIKKSDHRTFYLAMHGNQELCSKKTPNANVGDCFAESLGLCSSVGEDFKSYISASSFIKLARSLDISSHEIVRKMNSSTYMDTVLPTNLAFAVHMKQISKSYPDPVNMESAFYLSQLSQASHIQKSVENYRLKNVNCVGFTKLEFFDFSPSVSGNSIDFFGWKKPSYYSLQQSYAANIIVAQTDGLFINVYAINDELKDLDAILLCKMIDFSGNAYFVKQVPVMVKANSKALLLRLSKNELLDTLSSHKVALLLQLNQPGRTNAQKIVYFAEPKLLELPKTNIKVDINQANQGFNIILKSNVLVKNLFMETDRPDTRFSENNIDLLPGKRYKIFTAYKGSHNELTKNLVIKSLNNLQ